MTPSDLATRSLAAVWHPCTPMKRHETEPLLAVARAQGPWLYDTAGRRYLDAISSWWVNLFGHSHPHIRAALTDQLQQLDHVMLAGCTHAAVVELSEKLAALTGLGHASYGSDGASATEMALKMSTHYWRNVGRPEKNGFVGLAGGYHGETVGALSVTDVPIFRSAYAPLVRLSATVPSPDARAAQPGETAADVARRAAAALEAWLQQHHAQTAALIVEPLIQCAAGMAMYDPAYLRQARALCDRYQVHLVVDEIATGFGRTGRFFAGEYAGIVPDIMCLSKALTGGTIPLAAVLARESVASCISAASPGEFMHGPTYMANPLACAAGCAALHLFKTFDWADRVQSIEKQLRLELASCCTLENVKALRVLGAIAVLELRELPSYQRMQEIVMSTGVWIRPFDQWLYTMPPFITTPAEISRICNALRLAAQ